MQHYLTHSITGQASQASFTLPCEQAMWSVINVINGSDRKNVSSGFDEEFWD